MIMEALVCRCDVCVDGPPEMKNLKEEANILMQVIAAYNVSRVKFQLISSHRFFKSRSMLTSCLRNLMVKAVIGLLPLTFPSRLLNSLVELFLLSIGSMSFNNRYP